MQSLLDAYPQGAQLVDDKGCTCLHFACASGASAAVIETLLRHDAAGAKRTDLEGYLPLHYFALCSGRSLSRACDNDDAAGQKAERDQLAAGERAAEVPEEQDIAALQVLIRANKDGLTAKTKSGLLPLDCLGRNVHATDKMLRVMLEMLP